MTCVENPGDARRHQAGERGRYQGLKPDRGYVLLPFGRKGGEPARENSHRGYMGKAAAEGIRGKKGGARIPDEPADNNRPAGLYRSLTKYIFIRPVREAPDECLRPTEPFHKSQIRIQYNPHYGGI